MKTLIYSLDLLDHVAQSLLDNLQQHHIMTFTGMLGAGKTTLISTMMRLCGVVDQVSSPTFSYLNIYKNQHGETFYHFDLYRIQNLDAFFAAGFDEYLFAGIAPEKKIYVLIEWPAVIESLLNSAVLKNHVRHVTIDLRKDHHADHDQTERVLTVK